MSGITSRKCRLADLNAVGRQEFVGTLGGIFEHSPWVAEAVVEERPFASVEALLAALVRAVRTSAPERQLALIRAHPDLAGRLARQGELTPESRREQAAAGLSAADPATLARINELNAAYRARFDFPFIICARLNNVQTILEAMERRLGNDPAVERATALEEIEKIARLRLTDFVED